MTAPAAPDSALGSGSDALASPLDSSALAFSAVTGASHADSGPTAVILHGILGSGGNWRSFARRWVDSLPDWRVFLVDLRHHGESHGPFVDADTVDACAGDLVRLHAALGGPPQVVVGHSFGGKVALRYVLQAAARPTLVWSLDSPPGLRDESVPSGSGVEEVIATLHTVPMPLAKRSDVVPALRERGLSNMLAQWMTTNLRPADDGYVWTFDLQAVERLMQSFARTDAWPCVEDPPSGVCARLVRAAKSPAWSAEERRRFDALARAHADRALVLDRAGHWLHVQNPDGLWALMEPELAMVSSPASAAKGP